MNQVMRKTRGTIVAGFAVALALMAALACSPAKAFAADTVYTGRCGENTSWVYDSDGVLTITGSGEVVAKGHNEAHTGLDNFAAYGSGTGSGFLYMQHLAKALVVEEGITSLEPGLFRNYRVLERVTLPSSLESVQARTFANCRVLESVSFASASKLAAIDANAFTDCRTLKALTVPASVRSIGEGAFRDCAALERLALAKGSKLASIGAGAFEGCLALKDIDFGSASSLASVGADAFDSSLFSAKVSKATAKKGRKLAVTWNKTAGATKYVLYYKPSSASKYAKTTVKTTKKTLSKLKQGKKYKVYVVAYMGKTKLCKSRVKTSAKIKK